MTPKNKNQQKPTQQAPPEEKNKIETKQKPNIARDRKAYLNDYY